MVHEHRLPARFAEVLDSNRLTIRATYHSCAGLHNHRSYVCTCRRQPPVALTSNGPSPHPVGGYVRRWQRAAIRFWGLPVGRQAPACQHPPQPLVGLPIAPGPAA